jgi:hypothetical protein
MHEIGELLSAESAYNEDGVDLSLIRWMRSLTPKERLLFAQGFAQAVQKVRNAQDAARLRGNPERTSGPPR